MPESSPWSNCPSRGCWPYMRPVKLSKSPKNTFVIRLLSCQVLIQLRFGVALSNTFRRISKLDVKCFGPCRVELEVHDNWKSKTYSTSEIDLSKSRSDAEPRGPPPNFLSHCTPPGPSKHCWRRRGAKEGQWSWKGVKITWHLIGWGAEVTWSWHPLHLSTEHKPTNTDLKAIEVTRMSAKAQEGHRA